MSARDGRKPEGRVRALFRPSPAWSRRSELLALCLMAVSCASTTDEEAKPAEPDPALAWHESLLGQLGEAWSERDLDRMETLLSQPRAGATAEQVQRYETFGVLLESGRVLDSGFVAAGFALRAPERLDGGRMPPDLEFGQSAPLELRIQASEGRSYRVAKSLDNGARTRFVLTTRFEDLRVDGSIARSAIPYRFAAQRDIEISHDAPFLIELPPLPRVPTDVLMRKVRVEGRLVCASFELDGRALVVPKIELDAAEFSCFLKGFRTSKVRSDPLAVLKVAARDPARFAPHLLTASFFVRRDFGAKDRRAATSLLVEALRARSSAQRTIRAALLRVVGEAAAPELRDRDGWLRWWDLRRDGAKTPEGTAERGPGASEDRR